MSLLLELWRVIEVMAVVAWGVVLGVMVFVKPKGTKPKGGTR